MLTTIDFVRDNKIHKSILPIFNKSNNLELLLFAYKLYVENKKNLKNQEKCLIVGDFNLFYNVLAFQEYFKDFNFIESTDIESYIKKIKRNLNLIKANHYLKRTLTKNQIKTISSDSILLTLSVVEKKISLKTFKLFVSNVNNEHTNNSIIKNIKRLISDSEVSVIGKFKSLCKKNKEIHNNILVNNNNYFLLFGNQYDSNMLSEFGSLSWCTSLDDAYVYFSTNFYEKLFIYADYNKMYNDPCSLLGIVADDQNNILKIYDKFNVKLDKNENKDIFIKIRKLIQDHSFNFIHLKDKELTNSFFYFKKGNLELAKRSVEKTVNHFNAYEYHYLLTKLLLVYNHEDFKNYFLFLEEHNLIIRDSLMFKIENASQLECLCARNTSLFIIDHYIKKNKNNFINGNLIPEIINNIKSNGTVDNNFNPIYIMWKEFKNSKTKKERDLSYNLICLTAKELLNNINEKDFDLLTQEYMKANLDTSLKSSFVDFIISYKFMLVFTNKGYLSTKDLKNILHNNILKNCIFKANRKKHKKQNKKVNCNISYIFSIFMKHLPADKASEESFLTLLYKYTDINDFEFNYKFLDDKFMSIIKRNNIFFKKILKKLIVQCKFEKNDIDTFESKNIFIIESLLSIFDKSDCNEIINCCKDDYTRVNVLEKISLL